MIERKLNVAHSIEVSNVLKNYPHRLIINHKQGAGQKPGPACKKTTKKIVQAFRRNPNLSNRDIAKQEKGLNTSKVQKCPNREEHQNLVAKTIV